MSNKKGIIHLNSDQKSTWITLIASFFLMVIHTTWVQAGDLRIQSLDFTQLSGGKLQLQLEMNGPAVAPKVFHTDNPARIALDFAGVKSALKQKKYAINLDTADSVYVVESGDRVRVVINLVASVPYDTKVEGNKFYVTLMGANNINPPAQSEAKLIPEKRRDARKKVVSNLIPEQGIKGLDFRRGASGEGRILVSLAEPNTMVNTREVGGKVELTFVNTRLPDRLSKKLDVSEFATPVRFIDATASQQETKITIVLQTKFYDYSLFQSEGLLTIEFRPLTQAEKSVLDSQREKYTGDRLSLNFQDIDIRSVITLLAEFTGQNVVAGDDVTGSVTLKLDDVPWDEALDFMMMTKGLEKYRTGNVTLIAPVGKIKEYKEKQRETEKVVEQLEPLQTEYIKINYARAENFRNLLYGRDAGSFGQCGIGTNSSGSMGGGQGMLTTQGQSNAQGYGGGQNMQNQSGSTGMDDDEFSLMSPRGTVVVDGRTNTLIVRETASRLEEIRKLIAKLDVPVRQVMIESRIVIASNTFARDLGVRFGVAKAADIGSGKTFATGGAGTQSDINGQTSVNDILVDLAASNPYGALGMTLARGADYVLNLEISALQDEGKAELLSNPRVMTSDRCQASIKQGIQIPYLTVSQNGTQTQLIDAVLLLNVLPQITPSGSVTMDLNITKDAVGQIVAGMEQVPIDTREIQTNVQVMDGETVVLGGVFEGIQRDTVGKVPFFADLPGIGFLFKKQERQDDKTELLIFVTPKIVKDTVASN